MKKIINTISFIIIIITSFVAYTLIPGIYYQFMSYSDGHAFRSKLIGVITPVAKKNIPTFDSNIFFCKTPEDFKRGCRFALTDYTQKCNGFLFHSCEKIVISSDIDSETKEFVVNAVKDPCTSIEKLEILKLNDETYLSILRSFYRCSKEKSIRNYPVRQIVELSSTGETIKQIQFED